MVLGVAGLLESDGSSGGMPQSCCCSGIWLTYSSSMVCSSISPCDAVSSLVGNGGLTNGRELVSRMRINLQIALKLSNRTTTRQRVRSPPRRRATISQSNSVYCAIFRRLPMRVYKGDVFDQKAVYLACAVGFGFAYCLDGASEDALRVGDVRNMEARADRRWSW